MSETTAVTGDIVVGIDGSAGSEEALAWAIAEAARAGCGLRLVLGLAPLSPYEQAWLLRDGAMAADFARDAHAYAETLLGEKAKAIVQEHPAMQVATEVSNEDPRTALAELSESAHRLVVGSRGHGTVASLLLGSVGLSLVRCAKCPVVVVRPRRHEAPIQPGVVVGLSSVAHSRAVLSAAFTEASRRYVPLQIVLCEWDFSVALGGWLELEKDASEYDEALVAIEDAIDALKRSHPDVMASVLVARGAVDRCFVDLGRTRELLVIGRHGGGHPGWRRVGAGSTAVSVVEHAREPVMVVP